MQINAAEVTESFIQSNKIIKKLANDDPAPRPLHRQGTQVRQPIKHTVEAFTTQLNTK